jgi:hypothetical protein
LALLSPDATLQISPTAVAFDSFPHPKQSGDWFCPDVMEQSRSAIGQRDGPSIAEAVARQHFLF